MSGFAKLFLSGGTPSTDRHTLFFTRRLRLEDTVKWTIVADIFFPFWT